jgi:hypothetical protein
MDFAGMARPLLLPPWALSGNGREGGISMDTTTATVVVVALVVVAFIAWMYFRQRRSTSLRQKFGPEYERVVSEHGSTRRAEHELARRERRVERLTIRPLPAVERARYAERWNVEQARFVDEPRAAISGADRLVEEVMRARGYPIGEFEQRAADISVDHPQVIESYRAAHDIAVRESRGEASTEDLRKAMVYYRGLFEDLLEDRDARKGVPSR